MVDLKNLSEDVKTRVELAEQQNMRATRTVKGWLWKIDLAEVDVDRILQQGDLEVENKCLGSCFPKNFRLTYKLGKRVSEQQITIVNLLADGRDIAWVSNGSPIVRVD